MPLLPHHRDHLAASAIDPDVAIRADVRSIDSISDLPETLRWCGSAPGIGFTWTSLDGDTVIQYRPDTPVEFEGQPRKYLFPRGQGSVLNVHPDMAERVGATKVLIVEGTKLDGGADLRDSAVEIIDGLRGT